MRSPADCEPAKVAHYLITMIVRKLRRRDGSVFSGGALPTPTLQGGTPTTCLFPSSSLLHCHLFPTSVEKRPRLPPGPKGVLLRHISSSASVAIDILKAINKS